MRNKLLPVSGMIILFSLFSIVSMGFSGTDGFHGKPVLLQEAEDGAEKAESTTEPGPAEPDKDKARPKAPGESGPLTPFKPSEEIRADQAVDFPYDI